ncbi:hypothetical protein [Bifidobacterium aemilianum]|uniref:hypothetical protein n=1 Tax=Bifidobacterium aemilianum TaxID=2493120 RepID=UPI001F204193|nr:hypothetical protein [Bifidobacterium aemilianum]
MIVVEPEFLEFGEACKGADVGDVVVAEVEFSEFGEGLDALYVVDVLVSEVDDGRGQVGSGDDGGVRVGTWPAVSVLCHGLGHLGAWEAFAVGVGTGRAACAAAH